MPLNERDEELLDNLLRNRNNNNENNDALIDQLLRHVYNIDEGNEQNNLRYRLQNLRRPASGLNHKWGSNEARDVFVNGRRAYKKQLKNPRPPNNIDIEHRNKQLHQILRNYENEIDNQGGNSSDEDDVPLADRRRNKIEQRVQRLRNRMGNKLEQRLQQLRRRRDDLQQRLREAVANYENNNRPQRRRRNNGVNNQAYVKYVNA